MVFESSILLRGHNENKFMATLSSILCSKICPQKSQLSLLKFNASIASALVNKNTANVSVVGRPSKRKSDAKNSHEKCKAPTSTLVDDVR